MVLLYIIFGVYIAAINFYAVLLIKAQRDEYGDSDSRVTGDGKLILTALLGGAIALYLSMFIMRYRLKNLLLMILLPVFGVLNVYFFVWRSARALLSLYYKEFYAFRKFLQINYITTRR